MNVVVLVPMRAGDPHRDRLWAFCRQRWEDGFRDWPIIEGHHNDGPFNRSAALNQAAAETQGWDVAVIIDADIIADAAAVLTAVEVAAATGRMVVSHHERVMLNKTGTEKVLGGYEGPWRARQMVERVYTDSVSCCVAVPRGLWDALGGFDERFAGWGYEDTAFELAAGTLTGKPYIRLASELFHLHHAVSPEAGPKSPTRIANADLLERYKAASGNEHAMRALLDERLLPAETVPAGQTRIPRILHRTVPAETSEQVEQWWARFQELHSGWECRTYREPMDPADWPLTGDLWDRCSTGAQKAGLIRLEALVTHGGVYVDSDVEPVRSFEPLLHCPAVAAWEDETTVPDAVMASEPNHPAFAIALEKARAVIEGGGDAYQSGPAVTTEVLPGRPDVLLLPPGAFYPHHYLQKNDATANEGPWVFCRHMWHGSWLTPTQRKSIDKRQRA